MARFAVLNRHLVVGIAAVLVVIFGGVAAAMLRADPDAGPRVTLDRNTAALQAELEKRFPNIEQTFLAVVESHEPETSRSQALALSSALKERGDLIARSFVPGTGQFYDSNALLFQSFDEVKARVDAVLQMQPLYQAVAAAPDILGLAALVAEISRAVEQGRSPPGLETLLFAAAGTIEGEVRGVPHPIDWPALAGLKGETRSLRWFVLATPRPGLEAQAAAFAQAASEGMQGVTWLWPRRALAAPAGPLRDFIVPGGLSFFMLLALLAAGLGSFRHTAALLLCGAVTLSAAAAAAAVTGRVLDGATWSFAAAALAPVLVMGTLLILSYDQGRGRRLSPMQAAMLAAQQRGGLASATAFLFAAFWMSWLLRQLPSLSQFAVIALIAAAAAWATVMTLLPAAIALFERAEPRTDPHWLDDALADQSSFHKRNAFDILAMLVLAAAVFSAVFLPAIRFGERQLPSSPGPYLETPDARGAVNILVRPEEADATVKLLTAVPEVGAIRTAAQFMPPEVPAKLAELRRLAIFAASSQLERDPPDGETLRNGLDDLQQHLTAIASGPATTQGLRDAALRLRRAVGLFSNNGALDQVRAERLRQALFGGLSDLSRLTAELASQREPRLEDMSPELLSRFVSADGLWRIEVMPKPGVGRLSFAAALRRSVPGATGEPVADLVRNEIIHHETLLALAMAAVAAAMLVLAALRNLGAAVVSLVPVAAFVTLTAAASAILDINLNAAMLGGASTIGAVLLSSSMILAHGSLAREAESSLSPGRTMRAALLPPLALAGSVAPLAISSRPAIGDLGVFLATMLLIASLLCFLLVPAMSRWLGSLSRRTTAAPGDR